MSYIDGFVTPVPTSNKAAYLEHAKKFGEILKAEYGALRVVECWSDEVPPGKVTDFQGAVKAKEDEAIVFSWIEWPSKQVRDAFGEKMKTDPRMTMQGMPFDGMRMIYGGFTPIFDTGQRK